MWLHMLLQTGFNYVSSIPFAQLRQHIGIKKWEILQNGFHGMEGIETLVTSKTAQLNQYDETLEHIQNLKCRVGDGDMTEEEFIKATTIFS